VETIEFDDGIGTWQKIKAQTHSDGTTINGISLLSFGFGKQIVPGSSINNELQ
jgi:hypothetical protein